MVSLHELYAFFHKLRCMWRVGHVQTRPWSALEWLLNVLVVA